MKTAGVWLPEPVGKYGKPQTGTFYGCGLRLFVIQGRMMSDMLFLLCRYGFRNLLIGLDDGLVVSGFGLFLRLCVSLFHSVIEVPDVKCLDGILLCGGVGGGSVLDSLFLIGGSVGVLIITYIPPVNNNAFING